MVTLLKNATVFILNSKAIGKFQKVLLRRSRPFAREFALTSRCEILCGHSYLACQYCALRHDAHRGNAAVFAQGVAYLLRGLETVNPRTVVLE